MWTLEHRTVVMRNVVVRVQLRVRARLNFMHAGVWDLVDACCAQENSCE